MADDVDLDELLLEANDRFLQQCGKVGRVACSNKALRAPLMLTTDLADLNATVEIIVRWLLRGGRRCVVLLVGWVGNCRSVEIEIRILSNLFFVEVGKARL